MTLLSISLRNFGRFVPVTKRTVWTPKTRPLSGPSVSNKALQKLMGYHWPGNVRELGNVIERAILKTNGPVLREVDLPNSGGGLNGSGPTRFSDFELPLKEFLRRAECEYLTAVLKRNRGGISTTAEHAMIDAATLHRKMKLHALKRDDFREQPRP